MGAPPRILAIVGETATGKTDVGEDVAAAIGGEVVCADSRQVFAELDVGTGKPEPERRAARPHHLFDALHVGDAASAGWFLRAAREVCAGIHARGAVPVFVGGSGLYLEALRRGIAGAPPSDPARRADLRAEADRHGSESLHRRLAAADPETARRLAPRDTQRIIRALEVLESTGRPLSWWHARPHAPGVQGEWRSFRITCPAATLRERIERRTRWMFASGLVDETRALLEGPRAAGLRALRAIGYDEAIEMIEGRLDRGEAEARTSLRTIQFAKRQRTWFRNRSDAPPLDREGAVDAILQAVR